MQWMTMTNREVELRAEEVLSQYLKRGNSHKILQEILAAESIKYREIESHNVDFVGAFTRANNGQRYIMVNQAIENQGRKNFTLAHELGHHFLGHSLHSASFFCSDKNISEESQAADWIEHEANHFASCFLMPEQKIKPAFLRMLQNSRKAKIKDFLCVKNNYTFSIWCGIRDELMNRYGVSEAALRYRLKQLGLARFDFNK